LDATIGRSGSTSGERARVRRSTYVSATPAKWELAQIKGVLVEPRGEMKQAAADLEFERAAKLCDKARELEQRELQMRMR